ncbi:MAG: GHKL domain-containing protein [Peptococcaceae bacterium]|nr:GHKL domain-containing protein [Peptococcaceae bacterium]
MTVFDFADALTPFIEALMFFMLFEAFLKRREEWPGWCYGVGGLILAALIALSNYILLFSFSNAVFITCSSIIVSRILYRGLWKRLIFLSILGSLIVGITEIIVLQLITFIFSITVDEAIEIAEYRFLGIVVSKLLGLAVCNGIRIKNISAHKQYQEKKSYWILFILLFTGSLVAVFLIFKLTYEIGTTAYNGLAVFSAFALFFGTIFALYLYERLGRQSVLLREQEQYEQHLKSQLKHLDELLIKQKALRGFKHDVSNQLVALKGYFASGDAAGGMRHVDSLLQRVSDIEAVIDTGNIALDAVLSTKQTIAEHKGIVFEHHIRIAENLAVDPVDLCVIFGNALDNAIEACERLETADKRIVLDLRQEDSTLFCQLANTAPPSSDHSLATSKPDKDNHGFGFANLTASLEKYGGAPLVVWEKGWFTLSFLLFMSDAGQ